MVRAAYEAYATAYKNFAELKKRVAFKFLTVLFTSASGSCTVKNGTTLNLGGSFRGVKSETNFVRKIMRT